jgi:hypothetical protein
MGKTALLRSISRITARASGARTVWLSGAVIASEGHFTDALLNAIGIFPATNEPWDRSLREAFRVMRHARRAHARTVLILDDVDELVFKREGLLGLIAEELGRSKAILLIATTRPSAVPRLTRPGRPLASSFTVVRLRPLGVREARALVRRRVPTIEGATVDWIIECAGGHPAALVFLSRLVDLVGDASLAAPFLDRAAEFAGAAYADQWAALGPQQRAVIWQLSLSPAARATLGDLAIKLHLSASHVSAQVTRLMADGLVERSGRRGEYRVPTLFASWVVQRAVRSVVAVPIDRSSTAPPGAESTDHTHGQAIRFRTGRTTGDLRVGRSRQHRSAG